MKFRANVKVNQQEVQLIQILQAPNGEQKTLREFLEKYCAFNSWTG